MPTKQTSTMLLITDSNGHIIAAAPQGQPKSGGIAIGVSLLPGQQSCLVEIPTEMTRMKGDGLQMAFSRARLLPGQGKLDLGRFELRRAKEE